MSIHNKFGQLLNSIGLFHQKKELIDMNSPVTKQDNAPIVNSNDGNELNVYPLLPLTSGKDVTLDRTTQHEEKSKLTF